MCDEEVDGPVTLRLNVFEPYGTKLHYMLPSPLICLERLQRGARVPLRGHTLDVAL